MRYGSGLGQTSATLRPESQAQMPAPVAASLKEIPYDYVATFKLEGRRGRRVQDVISVTAEGAFVAVAIGYGFIPAPQSVAKLGGTVVFANLVNLTSQELALLLTQCGLTRLCGVDFKYSIIDSGSGRELQNLQIHNVAGLGSADGIRPFRPLAKPALFMPRSTVRIEVEEISEGDLYGYDDPNPPNQRITSELSIVFHGYKILGYGTT